MHVLITGAAGMIGRKLTARLVKDGALNGKPIDRLTLIDIVAPAEAGRLFRHVETRRRRPRRRRASAEKAIAGRPDVIFHLAGVVSGEAETDFEKGYRVNLDGTRALLEAIRSAGDGYKPKVVFTSSIAVFGAPFPDAIPDEFHLTPLTSYGTQKAMCELLLADYTRRGFLDGVGIRLPTICVRPGKPNKAASGFFSGIIREPLAGQEAMLPVAETRAPYPRQPALGGRLSDPRRRAAARAARAAHQSHHARRLLHGRRADRGARAHRRRQGRRAHPARAGRTGRCASSPAGRSASTPSARAELGFKAETDVRRHHPRPYRG